MHGDPGILQTIEPQRDADGDGRREEAGIQRRKGEQAAEAEQQGLPYSHLAAMAKLFASETASYVTNRAVQLCGGYGYTKDYPMERMMRDAKITEIYEGTSEVQRIVISANMGL